MDSLWPGQIGPYTQMYVEEYSFVVAPDGAYPAVQIYALPGELFVKCFTRVE